LGPINDLTLRKQPIITWMNRGNISNLIRRLGLIYTTDYIRFQILRARNLLKNRDYKRKNPGISFPPDYLLYESFAIDYGAYYEGGKTTADDLFDLITKYRPPSDLNILDWGCGPGRIIRHMPELFDPGCRFFGTDYNSKSITWCSENLPNITFALNDLSPPFNYKNHFFDVIYGISIITHLSREKQFDWIQELHRVLKKEGIMLLTSAGNGFMSILTQEEKVHFQNGDLVIRSRVKEGHRTYTAFHPLRFMQDLFSEFEILEHIEKEPSGNNLPQDIWIVQKK
jgi:SAM-dependent methyltransferase